MAQIWRYRSAIVWNVAYFLYRPIYILTLLWPYFDGIIEKFSWYYYFVSRFNVLPKANDFDPLL